MGQKAAWQKCLGASFMGSTMGGSKAVAIPKPKPKCSETLTVSAFQWRE